MSDQIYHRGGQSEFDVWHSAAMSSEKITQEGRINKINNIPAPEYQRTVAYSSAVFHPVNKDDLIWIFGDYPDANKPRYTLEEVKNAGFLPVPKFP